MSKKVWIPLIARVASGRRMAFRRWSMSERRFVSVDARAAMAALATGAAEEVELLPTMDRKALLEAERATAALLARFRLGAAT